MGSKICFYLVALIVLSLVDHIRISGSLDLDPNFYDEICPQALPAIERVVEEAVQQEPRMGASLLRLHFHDCFVNVRKQDHHLINLLYLINIEWWLCSPQIY